MVSRFFHSDPDIFVSINGKPHSKIAPFGLYLVKDQSNSYLSSTCSFLCKNSKNRERKGFCLLWWE